MGKSIELTQQKLREIRDMGFETWKVKEISIHTGVNQHRVDMVLKEAWIWEWRQCATCFKMFRYRTHVDKPRSYGICHKCAAIAWNGRGAA